MSRLIYSAIASVDGFVADEAGRFDWAQPDEEVHRFINDLERDVGTYLYGRRMYETMSVWESPEMSAGPAYIRDFAEIWKAATKIVYSRTLESVASERTTLERDFDAEKVRGMKQASARDISIAGPTLAAQAMKAGLVDELQLVLAPALVGGGLSAFPTGGFFANNLLEERRFESGMVFLRYELG